MTTCSDCSTFSTLKLVLLCIICVLCCYLLYKIQNYEKHFHQYSKCRIYEFPLVFGPFSVEELENFQYRLSKLFGVSPQSVLRLCRVEEGCLQLIFQVPSFVQQEIFPLSSEQVRALAAEGVIRLTFGDFQFAAKVCILMCSIISLLYDQISLTVGYFELTPLTNVIMSLVYDQTIWYLHIDDCKSATQCIGSSGQRPWV